jgi:cobalt-zinc-cadmium efflux system membrane fusion protein
MSFALPAIRHHLPTVITFAVLIGVFWWGHHNGWRVAKPVAGAQALANDDWCPEHHVTEEVCILCRKSLGEALAAQEPAAQRQPGVKPRFAQVATPTVLTKIGITAEPVTFGPTTPTLQVTGETIYRPGSVARLGSQSAGVVREVLVQVGAMVPAGALLAVCEAAEVGKAKSALMLALSQLDLARAHAERGRITAASGIRSRAELDDVEARLRGAEVAVVDAEQTLRNLGFTVAAADLAGLDAATLATRLRRLGLPDTYADAGSANLLPLRAPRAGMVSEILAVAGETIAAHAPLVVVADTATLWVAMPVTSTAAGQVAVGQELVFTPGLEPAVTGAVAAIAQAADPRTRLVTVWAEVPNPAGRLRVGAFGRATITTGAARTAAVIPPGSLQFDGDQAYVFVQRSPTIFRCLPVGILARNADTVAVDGLLAGDVIANSGTSTLFAIAFLERLGAGCCTVD